MWKSVFAATDLYGPNMPDSVVCWKSNATELHHGSPARVVFSRSHFNHHFQDRAPSTASHKTSSLSRFHGDQKSSLISRKKIPSTCMLLSASSATTIPATPNTAYSSATKSTAAQTEADTSSSSNAALATAMTTSLAVLTYALEPLDDF